MVRAVTKYQPVVGDQVQCAKEGCPTVFVKKRWNQKYCIEHVTTPDVPKREGVRICQYEKCRKQSPIHKSPRTKYCTTDHGKRQWALVKAREKKAEYEAKKKFENPHYQAQKREGLIYQKLDADRFTLNQMLDGHLTATAYAMREDVTAAGVTRAVHAHKARIELEKLQDDWDRSWRVKAMLPIAKMKRVRMLGLSGDTGDEFNRLIDELVHAYGVFSRYYFNLEGKRPLIKDFHQRWIRSIIVAYATGGKQLILSPPRYGKSETLIRFVVWFIVMDPNIRIGWFCAATDIAKLMLGAVKDILENNEDLIADTLPPGQLYDPGLKSGKPWSAKEIKVAQQTHIGAKSSSMLALGRTSKFLSRDMDIIIVDDLEDYDSTREESQRVYSRNKLAEIGTRKVEETAEIYIGSRQHPDDIPNLILELEDTILQWNVIVDSAHDENCGLDPEDYGAHVDCMLFPEVRSYRYLMEKKLEMETLGLAHLYPLRYLNQPIPAEGQVFDVTTVREKLNRQRGIGTEDLPLGILAAGLDPSARGIQAGFLWHYREGKLSMADLDAEQSGGIAGAHALMRDWHARYGLTMWFYEDNSQQVEFFNDPRTRKLALELGLTIKPFRTGRNKMDPELGISSMAPFYHSGQIDLPYGTSEARKKTNMLLRQLELWTTDGVVKKHSKTDIKMASWFPFPYFIKMMKEDKKATLNIGPESSYPGYGNYTEAPWGTTQYLGGR